MNGHAYFEDLITAYLDGETTPSEEAELRAHLEECPQCRDYLEAMKIVSKTAVSYLPPAPEGFARGVMSAIRAEEQKKRPKKKKIFRLPIRSLSLAAVVLLALWVGFRSISLFGAKGASAPPAQNMSTAADGVNSADDALPETAPAEGTLPMLNAPAEAPAAGAMAEEARDTGAETAVTYKIYAGEDLQADPLISGSNREMEKILITDQPCPAPERTADYTVTVLKPEEQIWLLWIEDGGLIIKDTRTETAGYSAAAEEFDKLLK